MGPSMNFWLAIVAAATDVATTAALLARAYEDDDLRGPEEWYECESHRRPPLSAAFVFLLNIVPLQDERPEATVRGPRDCRNACIYSRLQRSLVLRSKHSRPLGWGIEMDFGCRRPSSRGSMRWLPPLDLYEKDKNA